MAVSAPAAGGIGVASALGPQAISPALGWMLSWIATGAMPVPTEAELMSIAVLVLFFGGGIVWAVVTIVRWFFVKHHIIEEDRNVPLMPVINP